jgi:hypothetical protein
MCVLLGGFVGGLCEWQIWDVIPIEDIVRRAEKHFGVKVPTERVPSIENAGDLLDAIIAQLVDRDAGEVWEELRTVIVKAMGVARDEVAKTARFHYELN